MTPTKPLMTSALIELDELLWPNYRALTTLLDAGISDVDALARAIGCSRLTIIAMLAKISRRIRRAAGPGDPTSALGLLVERQSAPLRYSLMPEGREVPDELL